MFNHERSQPSTYDKHAQYCSWELHGCPCSYSSGVMSEPLVIGLLQARVGSLSDGIL